MSTPQEPLLPVEPDSPSRLKLWILLAGAGAAASAILIVVLALRGKSEPSVDSSAPAVADRSDLRAPKKAPADGPASGSRESSEERRAKDLYDAAEAFERAQPADYEQRAAHWREVVTTYPTSAWARKADEKHRATTASLQAFLDREFESTRKDARALAAAGHFVDALDTIRAFKNSQTRELLRRRADVEIGALENGSREAFNAAAAKAKDLAARRDYAAALALVESVAGGAIPEVAARCRSAIDQLRNAVAAQARHDESRKGEEARRAFRRDVAPKLLGLVRARRYEEALQELGSSAAPLLKDDVAAERAAIADASSFWESFLKAARARVGQDATVLLADGRRVSGRIARVQPDRIVLDAADGAADAPLEKLHADLLVGWTLGRTLPAEDPVSYLKAALFFFCEGRDDLAKLYLATARELSGDAAAAEKVFREGFLRAATALRK
jgi:hypothetical protein